MNYFIKSTKLCLFFLLFVHFQSHLTWAAIYIDFLDDGEITYSLHEETRKRTKINVDDDWKDIKKKIDGKEVCFFKVIFLKERNRYKLEIKDPIPKEENIIFRISHKSFVKLKGSLNCHSLNLNADDKKKGAGTFINKGDISFIDTDKNIKNEDKRKQSAKKYGLRLNDSIHFINKRNLIFQRKVILSLKDGYFTNKYGGLVQFEQESRIVGKRIGKVKNNFLLFSDDNFTRLSNYGTIKGVKKLGLFSKCFVSEKGIIQAKQIVMDWDNRSGSGFKSDIETSIPLTKEDKNYPILDIVRIPETITQEYSLNAGSLGEEAACHFYETFKEKKSFSHKSNSQENGIDVIAYDNTIPNQLIIHESKNYHNGSFALASNQMTKSWVYGYLFRMYQDFLKENIRILETSKRHLRKSHYNHIKIVLFNILLLCLFIY